MFSWCCIWAASWKATLQCLAPRRPARAVSRLLRGPEPSTSTRLTALLPSPTRCPRPAVKALRAVHGRFYAEALPIGVGLIGPGLIGGTFLKQLHEQVGRGGTWQ